MKWTAVKVVGKGCTAVTGTGVMLIGVKSILVNGVGVMLMAVMSISVKDTGVMSTWVKLTVEKPGSALMSTYRPLC